jgi:hypothetical protein
VAIAAVHIGPILLHSLVDFSGHVYLNKGMASMVTTATPYSCFEVRTDEELMCKLLVASKQFCPCGFVRFSINLSLFCPVSFLNNIQKQVLLVPDLILIFAESISCVFPEVLSYLHNLCASSNLLGKIKAFYRKF